MSIATLIRNMADAGAPPEAIALAVEAIEAEQAKELARKAKRAAQKRKERNGCVSDETVARHGGDIDTTVDPQSGDMLAIVASPPLPNKEKSPTPPKEINPSSTSLRSELSSARAEEIFETEFWPAYPKRDGSNPKQPAKTKFVAHVKSGIDPAKIIAGVKAYSIFMTNDEPRFVMQATRFLNQKCWQDDYSVRAQGPPKPKQDTWADTADWFLRGEDDDGSRREESSHEVVELSREDWTRA